MSARIEIHHVLFQERERLVVGWHGGWRTDNPYPLLFSNTICWIYFLILRDLPTKRVSVRRSYYAYDGQKLSWKVSDWFIHSSKIRFTESEFTSVFDFDLPTTGPSGGRTMNRRSQGKTVPRHTTCQSIRVGPKALAVNSTAYRKQIWPGKWMTSSKSLPTIHRLIHLWTSLRSSHRAPTSTQMSTRHYCYFLVYSSSSSSLILA